MLCFNVQSIQFCIQDNVYIYTHMYTCANCYENNVSNVHIQSLFVHKCTRKITRHMYMYSCVHVPMSGLGLLSADPIVVASPYIYIHMVCCKNVCATTYMNNAVYTYTRMSSLHRCLFCIVLSHTCRPSFRNCVQGAKLGGANSFILILCLHVIVP